MFYFHLLIPIFPVAHVFKSLSRFSLKNLQMLIHLMLMKFESAVLVVGELVQFLFLNLLT